jgi:hypothetical protein
MFYIPCLDRAALPGGLVVVAAVVVVVVVEPMEGPLALVMKGHAIVVLL